MKMSSGIKEQNEMSEEVPEQMKPPVKETITYERRRKIRRRKSERWQRGRRTPAPFNLSNDEMIFLKKNTRYDEEEIKDWYRGFRNDCPDGTLTKKKILEMYEVILPNANSSLFVDQIFRIFDKDGNGTIDFKEFMMATDMTASGTVEEKLRWAFKMYDEDSSGTIEMSEMTDIIGTLYEMEGISRECAVARAKKIFMELDVNGDGEISEEEFVKGCLKDQGLVRLLNAGGEEEVSLLDNGDEGGE
ncbi:neuronal calcium sensor 2 [Lepeophtheirus salmonis]|nr:neuronal calcium sensor 2-like [Lepeophtheirus salmonis]XP_040583469.1 neuronal calcium sensor 2-like [Lepeophtheirus salmonis]